MRKSLRWRIWTVYFYFAARPTVVFFGRVLFYFLPLPLFSRCVAGGWRARDLEGRGDGRTYTHSPERFRRAPFNTNNNNVRACPCLSARLRVNRPGKNPRYTKGKTRETLNSPPTLFHLPPLAFLLEYPFYCRYFHILHLRRRRMNRSSPTSIFRCSPWDKKLVVVLLFLQTRNQIYFVFSNPPTCCNRVPILFFAF